MNRYYNGIQEKNKSFSNLLQRLPSDIVSGSLADQQNENSEEWELGNNSPYALTAQSNRPDNVIKDVYDTRTGRKVGAYNTQTGTKYFQSSPSLTNQVVENNNAIVKGGVDNQISSYSANNGQPVQETMFRRATTYSF